MVTTNLKHSGFRSVKYANKQINHLSNSPKGYINFFPPNPSQDEEILTEANVKHGYLSVVPFSVSCDSE